MKYLIIEDEPLAQQELVRMLKSLDPNFSLLASIDSVKESVEFIDLNTVQNNIYVNKGYSNKQTYQYNQEDFDAIKAAFDAYVACSNVTLPQNGKAYRIVNVQNSTNNHKEYYLLCNENKSLSYTTAQYAEDAFICRVVDDKIVFVNKLGKYLTLTSTASDKYEENCNLSVSKLNVEGVDPNATFAYLSISGYSGGILYYLHAQPNGGMSRLTGSPIFSDGYSGAFKFIEVEYPNNVTLTAYGENDLISNLPGATIGTFSAPFPTVLPENVTAYYASGIGERVSLTKVEAAALPANQGVILVGATAENTKALMIPATDEQQADITDDNNIFKNSAGHKASMQEGDYVLARGRQDSKIGFYPVEFDNSNGTEGTSLAINKAYLRLGTQGTSAFRLVVDETVTGIEGVATEKADVPIYDLSGRRLDKPTKGINVVGGKLVIK